MNNSVITGILSTKNYTEFEIVSSDDLCLVSFQGATKANKALPGDVVEWQNETCTIVKRANYGCIAGVVELASKTTYGITSRGVPIYLFVPCDPKYPPCIVGSACKDRSQNQYGLAKFETWTTTTFPRLVLQELLGPVGIEEAEYKALRWTYNPHIPLKLTSSPDPQHHTTNFNDRDTCPTMTFNIDPDGCRDIDDVLSLEETHDQVKLWITIADVAETVLKDTELDKFAALQGQTAYENGLAIKPMLPHIFSEDVCSLLPDQSRPGVSLVLTYKKEDSKLSLMDETWKLTKLVNAKSFTYDTFTRDAPIFGISVERIQSIAEILLGRKTDDTHEWIEAFMLHYNKAAAKLLDTAGKGILRVHDMVDIERYRSYEGLGDEDLLKLATPAAKYCKVGTSIPYHWGLDTQLYCHASSPIRRYADLVNQRILKQMICNQPLEDSQISIVNLNQRSKDLKRFERDRFLLSQLYLSTTKEVKGLVLEKKNNNRVKLWISDWKRTITWKPCDCNFEKGNILSLRYTSNASARSWKDHMVFQLVI